MIGEAEARAVRGLVKPHGPLMSAMAVEYHGLRYSWSGEPRDEITVERRAMIGAPPAPGRPDLRSWAWVPDDRTLPAPERRTVTAFLARVATTT